MGSAGASIGFWSLSARCGLSCLAALASLAAALPADLRAHTWNGRSRSSSNWSDTGNWVEGVLPVSNGLADIIFENSPWPSPNQDIANPFRLHSLTIKSGNYKLQGNPLSFEGVFPNAPSITQNATSLEIQNDLDFAGYTWLSGPGSTKLSGHLTGQAFIIENSGPVNLTGGADIWRLYAKNAAVSITAGTYQFNDLAPWVIHEGASVSITNGATITSYGVSQMNGIGSSVLISGEGSTFTSRFQEYYIAHDSAGTVTVENGGLFDTENLRISNANGGSGKLVVNAGGTAFSNVGYIGAAAGGTGTVEVNGINAHFVSNEALYLGGTALIFNQGIGHINVSNNGSVLITGPTSIWTAGSTITVNGTFYTASLHNIAANGTINLTDGIAGPALVLSAAAGQATFGGAISGSGSIRKSSNGTQTLSGANTWTGATIVDGGTLILPNSTSSSYTVNSVGTISTLVLGASNFGSASLRATGLGSTIQYTAPNITGGILSGNATHDIDAVSSFTNSTFASGVSLTQNARLTLNNVTNSGNFLSNASLIANGGSNAPSGNIIANVSMQVASYLNSGTITINGGASLTNTANNLLGNPGSRITVHNGAQIFLDTGSLELHAARLTNNGNISGPTNLYAGSLATGNGNYGPLNLFDGGKFSPGNSPGAVTTAATSWNSGGTYLFEIDSATGSPGLNWDLWNVSGNLAITAGSTPGTHFTISIASLTAGNLPGNAANFNLANNYSWLIASASAITGFDPAKFNLDTSQFTNFIGTGKFSLTQAGNNLLLNFAAPPQWNLDADGTWSTPGNWLPAAVPNDPRLSANFLGKITAPRTVTLDGNQTVGAIVFDNQNSYTIAPGSTGTLTIRGGIDPTGADITVITGNHTISAPLLITGNVNTSLAAGTSLNLSGPIAIASAQTLSQSQAGTLTISGPQTHQEQSTFTASAGQTNFNSNAGAPATDRDRAVANLTININGSAHVILGANQDLGSLNIATGDPGPQQLDLNSPSGRGEFHYLRIYADDLRLAKASLYEALTHAHGPRSPDSTDGIYDSSLDSHRGSAVGLAQLTDAFGDSHIFIRPTRIGDVNLDGSVTISDFIDLASHFNGTGTWQEGDLNYDGQITISDFIDLAANFNSSYAGETWPISADDSAMLSAFAAAHGATVPEPASIACLGLLTSFLSRRRRRAV